MVQYNYEGKYPICTSLKVTDLRFSTRGLIDVANFALEGVKQANRFGMYINEQIASGIGLVDIREISFQARLAVVKKGSFKVKIRVSFFMSSEKTYSFRMNMHSLDSMIQFLVDEAKGALPL